MSGATLKALAAGIGLGAGVTMLMLGAEERPAATIHEVAAKATEPGNPPLFYLDKSPVFDADLPAAVRVTLYNARVEARAREGALLREVAVQLIEARDKKIDVQAPGATKALTALVPLPDEPQTPGSASGAGGDAEARLRIRYEEGFERRFKELTDAGRVKLVDAAPLIAPPSPKVDTSAFPSRGQGEHELLVLSEVACAECAAVTPIVEVIALSYAGRVRVTTVDFARVPDGPGGALATGAACAARQTPEGYAQYRANLSRHAASSTLQGVDGIALAKELAKDAKIEPAAFAACLGDAGAKERATAAASLAAFLGVREQLAIFLDGRPLSLRGDLMGDVERALGGAGGQAR